MANRETTIIPLDDAHEILTAFGIGPSSREYQRWRRDDGFRQVDFEDVLTESTSVLIVDGRELLQDAAERIVHQLDAIGISASIDLGEEGEEGTLQVEGRKARIKYIPNDNDDFDEVIASINRLISKSASYKKFRSCEGSDGWSYAVLKGEEWNELEKSVGPSITLLFNTLQNPGA